jgi:hypothetical protein
MRKTRNWSFRPRRTLARARVESVGRKGNAEGRTSAVLRQKKSFALCVAPLLSMANSFGRTIALRTPSFHLLSRIETRSDPDWQLTAEGGVVGV